MKLGMWGAKRSAQGLTLAGDAGNMGHPVCGEGYGETMESGCITTSWAYEARGRKEYSASLLSGYERQLRRRSAGEYLSGRAIMKLLPHMEQLNPLIRACEGDRLPAVPSSTSSPATPLLWLAQASSRSRPHRSGDRRPLLVARYDEFSLHAEEVGEYHQREVVSRMGEEGGGGVHVLAQEAEAD
jgi:flavin-dependent dehydrogenase